MSIVSQSYFLETAGLFYMHLLDIPWLAQHTHIYAYSYAITEGLNRLMAAHITNKNTVD